MLNNTVAIVLGLVIMVLGTVANLHAAERAPDKYDERHITLERIDQIVEDFFQKRNLEDGGIIKAPQKVEKVSSEDVKHSKEAIADSEVQPPNPVPPESPETVREIADKKKKDTAKEVKQEVDKVPETHPKNLNKITGEKRSNGETKKEQKTDTQLKDEIKQMNNRQKMYLKQAQLARTIKQYEEKQKELSKEQKEILDNMIKTKHEIRQDKNEAKKIAVEFIEKIANLVFLLASLSAFSEQRALCAGKIEPGDTENEAVKKIADVAVEAIKDKPIEPLPSINNDMLARQIPEAKAVPVQNGVDEVRQNEPVAQNSINNVNLITAKSQYFGFENSGVKIDLTKGNTPECST